MNPNDYTQFIQKNELVFRMFFFLICICSLSCTRYNVKGGLFLILFYFSRSSTCFKKAWKLKAPRFCYIVDPVFVTKKEKKFLA